MNNKKGFTLIEILIVISIIGILASIVLVNLGGFRARGRDAKRISEVKGLQNTLELYYSVNSKYPTSLDLANFAPLGVSVMPKDPTSGQPYFYGVDDASNPTSYIVGATLEGDNAVLKDDVDGTVFGINCGTTDANDRIYCVKF